VEVSGPATATSSYRIGKIDVQLKGRGMMRGKGWKEEGAGEKL